jgi:hypothetical protein
MTDPRVAAEGLITTPVTAGSGALTALVALGTFTYNIVKDHGYELKFNQAPSEGGVSTVPDDYKIPLKVTKRYDLCGVWYTHIRAWKSTAHSLYPHTRTGRGTTPGGAVQSRKSTGAVEQDASKFSSTYLCTVFPFKASYNVATIDVDEFEVMVTDAEAALLEQKRKVDKEAVDMLAEQVKTLKSAETPDKPAEWTDAEDMVRDIKTNLDDLLTRDNNRRLDRLLDMLGQDDLDVTAVLKLIDDEIKPSLDRQAGQHVRNMGRVRGSIKTLVEQIRSIPPEAIVGRLAIKPKFDLAVGTKSILESRLQSAKAAYLAKKKVLDKQRKLLKAVRKKADTRKYMTDFRLVPDSGFGVAPKSWQNVKVNATFAITRLHTPEDAPGVEIAMHWEEKVPGYGKPWDYTMKIYPGEGLATGSGRLVERFNQFAVLKEVT